MVQHITREILNSCYFITIRDKGLFWNHLLKTSIRFSEQLGQVKQSGDHEAQPKWQYPGEITHFLPTSGTRQHQQIRHDTKHMRIPVLCHTKGSGSLLSCPLTVRRIQEDTHNQPLALCALVIFWAGLLIAIMNSLFAFFQFSFDQDKVALWLRDFAH